MSEKEIVSLENYIPSELLANDTETDVNLFFDITANSLDEHKLRTEIKDAISTYIELENLYASIEQYGITLSLLSFANRNNLLSDNIKDIPSLESFTTPLSVKESQAALEGIQETLKDIYNRTIGKVSKLTGHVLTSLKIRFRSIPAMRFRIDNFTRDISGKEFDEDKASKITGNFVSYEQILELLNHAIDANKVIMELLSLQLPMSEEEFVEFKAKLEAFKKKYEPNYRIGKMFKYTIPSAASLKDKGYKAESFHVIASKLDEYIRQTLATETSVDNQWIAYDDRVDKILQELSTTYKTILYGEIVKYTKLGRMLIEATDEISNIALDIYGYSFRDGPVKAINTLSNLKNAYK